MISKMRSGSYFESTYLNTESSTSHLLINIHELKPAGVSVMENCIGKLLKK
jgi:hypothetical protein